MHDELRQFDQQFTPSSGRRPGIESLPDGDHDFTIISADLGRTEKTNELILRLVLRTASGSVYEYAYFFRTQQSVDILGSDLCTLGIDADQWKPPARPFSSELPLAVPRLVGLAFRGKKKTSPNPKDPSKPFHNLYVNQRLDNTMMPPEYKPDSRGLAYSFGASSGSSSDPIPF